MGPEVRSCAVKIGYSRDSNSLYRHITKDHGSRFSKCWIE